MAHEECLICGAPLIYLDHERMMRCTVCGKEELSRTCCEDGHYVCDACHTEGIGLIPSICLRSKEKNPVTVLEMLMNQPFCHMHGPEHHSMVGAALLTAYANAGGDIDLPAALQEMIARGRKVPGGVCGFWGACGAGISTGIFVSIITKASPLAGEAWGLSNLMTSASLAAIGALGGPRCCKRDSYLAIQAAVKFCAEHFGVEMEFSEIKCSRSGMNNQCIASRCPFHTT